MSIKKVLVIRFSSIGDIVLTSPVVRALKVQLENVEVHFCTKIQYKGIVESNPYISKVICFDDNLNQLITILKRENYDYIVDLHNNLRTKLIKSRLRKASQKVNKLNFEKWLYVTFKINKMPNVHIVDRYMDTIKPLGIKKDGLGLDYFIPHKDEIELEWLPKTHQNGYIAYAIGAQHNTKKLPVKRMIELCDKINKPIILLGGKEDFETGEVVANFFKKNEASKDMEPLLVALNKKADIYNACGKYNLNQSASILKHAKAVFSHDTGLMHIAAAFKKEIFSIWGNTSPHFGMYPYKTKFTIFENNRLHCRPCSKIGFRKCPQGHFKCMNDLVFDFYIP